MKILFLIGILASSFANAYEPSCSKNGTVVVFSNGIDSSRKQAKSHIDKLEGTEEDSSIADFLNPKIDKGYSKVDKPNHVQYVLCYNSRLQDEGLIDFTDSVRSVKFLVESEIRRRTGLTP